MAGKFIEGIVRTSRGTQRFFLSPFSYAPSPPSRSPAILDTRFRSLLWIGLSRPRKLNFRTGDFCNFNPRPLPISSSTCRTISRGYEVSSIEIQCIFFFFFFLSRAKYLDGVNGVYILSRTTFLKDAFNF